MAKTGLAVLRDRNFGLYSLGNFSSLLGTWAQRVAVLWLAWELTHSTLVLGVLTFFDLLPSILTSPLGGTIADREDRFKLSILLQYLSALPPALMALAFLTDQLTIEVMLIVTTLGGLFSGVDHPLRLSLVSNLSSRENVPAAVSVNAMIFNLSRLVGPALSGYAIAADALILVFIGNLLSFMLFAISLTIIQSRLSAAPQSPEKRDAKSTAPQKWSAVWPSLPFEQKITLFYLTIVSFALRPAFEMLPAIASRLSEGAGAASAFAMLSSSVGFGAFFGAFLAPRFGSARAILGLGIFGALAIAGLLLTESLILSLIIMSFASAAILAGSISTQILLQLGAPIPVRGKALACYTMILRGTPAVGTLLVGLMAQYLPLSIVFAAAAVVVTSISLMLLRQPSAPPA